MHAVVKQLLSTLGFCRTIKILSTLHVIEYRTYTAFPTRIPTETTDDLRISAALSVIL